jgi:hypothetical protein
MHLFSEELFATVGENDLLKARQVLVFTVLLLLVILGCSTVVNAAAPYPSTGSATVDGNTAEWNLPTDFFADMTRAGMVDANHPVESKVYLRYDITNQVLYVLVLAEPGIPAIVSVGDAWAAINDISSKVFTGASVNDATQPNFAWVGQGYDGNNAHALGYEASFSLAPGNYLIILHLEVFDDGETQTSATEGLKAGIDLFVVPEYLYGGIAAMAACFGGFAVFKSRSSIRAKIHK